MHEMSYVPEVFKTPEYERLFILAEIGNFTPEEYKQYQNSLKFMSDYYNIIDTAVEEAEKRGRVEEKYDNAKNLKALGIAEDIIAKATGLSLEVIRGL